MGALHEGHLSLLKNCEKNSFKVCSIFVNPTQFNDQNDLNKYPKPLSRDVELLLHAGCNLLFLPSYEEIYPDQSIKVPSLELNGIDQVLEGRFRPGHFDGMLQVVNRLLQIVQPGHLYMGQKDYQQQLLVRELISQQMPEIKMHCVPTLREPSGLAMSSRNIRLSMEARSKAALIYKTLMDIALKLPSQEIELLEEEATQILTANGFQVEYICICDANSMQQKSVVNENESIVIALAVQLDGVRLIDNILWSRKKVS